MGLTRDDIQKATGLSVEPHPGIIVYGELTDSQGGLAPIAITPGIPVGCVFDYGGTIAPTGYLLCDQDVSRTTYATLFSVIGTTYGAGDGSTTFGLPPTGGRVTVGVGTHADVASRGLTEGVAAGSRRPKHGSSIVQVTNATVVITANAVLNDPQHLHTEVGFTTPATIASVAGGGGAGYGTVNTGLASTGITFSQQAAYTIGTQAVYTVGPQTAAPVDTPAYVVMNKIIKF